MIEQPPSSHVSYYLWKTDSDQILLLHVWRTLRKKSSETTVCYATFLYTSGENNGSVDITHCVVEIDLSVFLSSNPFVCIRCYKRLLRFDKAKTNLRSPQEETKEGFKKGANRTKRLCRNSAEKDGDIENINVLIKPSTAWQVQQRSAARSLKLEQFPTVLLLLTSKITLRPILFLEFCTIWLSIVGYPIA